MNINDLTLGDIKKIGSLLCESNQDQHPYEIGANYFIRTVTHYFTGRLVAVYPQELVIEEAAWIADTGRYADAIKSGNFSEVEPYPAGEVGIGRGSIVDFCKVEFVLPREQK